MANQTASQGVFLSALHGMILTILGMAVIPYFLRMFTSDEVTISYGLTYFLQCVSVFNDRHDGNGI